MGSYSIDQFSQITGLNKILIRTWENRYNFVTPVRTSTNIRTYDDDMLTKGIKYSVLVENGYKISKLVKCKDEEINNLIEEILKVSKNKNLKNDIYVSKFIESSLYFNQDLFDKTYNTCLEEIGFINFYKEILIETMSRISLLFLNNKITSANEHFLSENIRIKISYEISQIKSKTYNNKKWILFLPENEYHDIGLLFTSLILKKYNQKIVYLGQNTTRESLLQFNQKNTNFLLFLNARKTEEFINKLCSFLSSKLFLSQIYVIDKAKLLSNKFNNINSINSIDKFIALLES